VVADPRTVPRDRKNVEKMLEGKEQDRKKKIEEKSVEKKV